MQLHWAWAVLGALVLGAAFVWWNQPADEARDGSADAHHAEGGRHAHDHDDAGPTLYRWVDAGGVVNISTDRPPAGRHYTIVHVNPNQNIVPMGVGNASPGSPATAH
jgi:hypothetical protein